MPKMLIYIIMYVYVSVYTCTYLVIELCRDNPRIKTQTSIILDLYQLLKLSYAAAVFPQFLPQTSKRKFSSDCKILKLHPIMWLQTQKTQVFTAALLLLFCSKSCHCTTKLFLSPANWFAKKTVPNFLQWKTQKITSQITEFLQFCILSIGLSLCKLQICYKNCLVSVPGQP